MLLQNKILYLVSKHKALFIQSERESKLTGLKPESSRKSKIHPGQKTKIIQSEIKVETNIQIKPDRNLIED